MKNKTNNVTSHIGKKLLVLGIITVYLCMATACGTNKNNNNSGSMAASPSPSTSPAAQGRRPQRPELPLPTALWVT